MGPLASTVRGARSRPAPAIISPPPTCAPLERKLRRDEHGPVVLSLSIISSSSTEPHEITGWKACAASLHACVGTGNPCLACRTPPLVRASGIPLAFWRPQPFYGDVLLSVLPFHVLTSALTVNVQILTLLWRDRHQ